MVKSVTLIRECQLDASIEGRWIQCTDGPVCARETLHVVISILGSARVILRSLKVQMSRDRLPIGFIKVTGSFILY